MQNHPITKNISWVSVMEEKQSKTVVLEKAGERAEKKQNGCEENNLYLMYKN